MTDTGQLRVAIVGAGSVATIVHLPIWRAAPDVRLTWVVDTCESAARSAAERFGIPRWSTDPEAVLAADDVDVLDLCTPAAKHAEHAVRALERGLHVLVEKPLAEDPGAASAMVAAADASPGVAMVAENWVFSTGFRWASELIGQSVIGDEIYMMDAAHETDFALRHNRPNGSDPGQLGYFAVTGPHVISAARHLLGELAKVRAYATPAPVDPRTLRPLDTDMSVSASFVSGAVGTMHFSGRMRHKGDPVRTIRVLGSAGWVRFDPFSAIGEWADRDGVHRVEHAASSAGHAETISHFVLCCRTGQQPLTSFADQAKTVTAVDAVYNSLAAATAVGTDSAGAR